MTSWALGLTPPSRATLARAFAAAGVSKAEPRKRPRAANRRFVYPAPTCCWQIDAFAWSLADGTPVAIHQVIDDHSRMAVATLVADGETAKAAVQVVSSAVRRWGVPQRLLSDNGLAFNPTRARTAPSPAALRHRPTPRCPRPPPPPTPNPSGAPAPDRVDTHGKVSLRYAGRLRHLGIGPAHAGTAVLMLIRDHQVITSNATTGEIIAEPPHRPRQGLPATTTTAEPTKKPESRHRMSTVS